MNEIVNTFLLAGNKFTPEMHLKPPNFTNSACKPFTKNKERIGKFCRLEIQILFTEMSKMKPVSRTIWLMVNRKTQ